MTFEYAENPRKPIGFRGFVFHKIGDQRLDNLHSLYDP